MRPRKFSQLLHRTGLTSRALRLWFEKAAGIALRMAKGAYLVGERRRWLEHLGGELVAASRTGEAGFTRFEKTLRHIERLTKKIESEEQEIHLMRQMRLMHQMRTDPTEAHHEPKSGQP